MSWLKRLQDKPPHVKTNIAFFSAVAFTLVVASIWSVSLPAKLISVNNALETDAESDQPSLLDRVQEVGGQLGTIIESDRPAVETEEHVHDDGHEHTNTLDLNAVIAAEQAKNNQLEPTTHSDESEENGPPNMDTTEEVPGVEETVAPKPTTKPTSQTILIATSSSATAE